ncbi:N-acetyltransferase [Galactobacter caseinivorans]|uniref:N-acetyltransferase n=2 Tax=Galactobacter caseinivorans TaxID=2676123 RepID=A0A496PJB8_9MICC|nr:N-acetyltransferase [Galactobacter caseinivorans]
MDPLTAVAWPVRTERLSLRRATLADMDAMWEYRRLDSVGEWLGWHPVDRADWDATFPSKLGPQLVVELEGRIIGDLMILVGDAWGQREVKEQAAGTEAELGWVFHPDFGGRGYATEAVHAAIGISFEQVGLRRVTAGAFFANEASWRLMERVGMRRESVSIKESLHRDHGWIDGILYALLKDEWAQRGASS